MLCVTHAYAPAASAQTASDYRAAAEAGDADAQANLGLCYEHGTGVEMNQQEAVRWYRKAAEAGSPQGQEYLGVCYENGQGVTKNAPEAVRWYRKAAEAGHARAQYYLGLNYHHGIGVTKDEQEAVMWYRKAAEAGDADAQANLGWCFEQGAGVPVNQEEAVMWYRKAAEAGNARGQEYLGLCYENGQGVTKDAQEAVVWYRKAAEADHARAQYYLGLNYQHGIGVAQDEQEAVSWYRKAAEAGDADAQVNLGVCYEHAIGVEKDEREAFGWYRKAAEAGNADAVRNLGLCYQDGKGVTKDGLEALRCYRKAADAGSVEALNDIGICYEYGIGVAKDLPQAFGWYRKAAEAGNVVAQRNLGLCYQEGTGVAADPVKAVMWFQISANGADKDAKASLDKIRRQMAPASYAAGLAAAQAWQTRHERPKSPPLLTTTVAFAEPSGNNALDADETGNLTITVQNKGKGASWNLRARLQAKPALTGLSLPVEVVLGDVEPGGTITKEVPLSGLRGLAASRATVEVSLVDKFGFDAPLVRQGFETRAFVAPKFAVKLGVDDGNGNGLIERGEELTLKVQVQNEGGAARGVRLGLTGPDGLMWLGAGESVDLGDIPAGGWRQASFSCLVRNQYAGPDALSLVAAINDARPDLGGTFPIAFTLNQAGPRVVEQMAQAKAEERAEAPAPELSDPVDQAPTRNQRQPEAHAVIVGIERYKNALVPPVSHARRDATIVREYMTRTLGIPPENVHLLVDHEATLADLRTAIAGKLANALDDPNARVYVYFAGHGAPNLKTKQPYLVPHDGNPAYPETSCYPLSELYESLGKLTVPVTVMLDACFSGSAGRGDAPETLLANARPALVELKDTGTPPNVSVLAAANGDQVSSSYAAKRHGLFTYFLLKGLGGAADEDKDGRLTLEELHRFVTPAVRKQARKLNREQTPTLQGAGGMAVY
jgi:TPR repeat protein